MGTKKKEETYGAYQVIVFPIILLIAVSAVPETSLLIAVLSGIYCALLILFVLLSNVKKWHRSRRFRILFGLTQIDVSAILIAVLATRMMESSVGVFLLVMGLFLLGILIGHRYSWRIIDELQKPKTLVGKLLVAFGSLGGGLAALFTYWFSQFVPGVALISFICGGMLLLLIIIHAYVHESWPTKE